MVLCQYLRKASSVRCSRCVASIKKKCGLRSSCFPTTDVTGSDVWLADMNYRVAVTQQSRVWKGVSAKLGDLFGRMKDIEVERRMVRASCACVYAYLRACVRGSF